MGDFVLVSGELSRLRRWGQLFADDGEQDRPFLVRFHDGMEPELSWCDLERVRTVDKALEDASDQEEEYQCPICFTPFEQGFASPSEWRGSTDQIFLVLVMDYAS